MNGASSLRKLVTVLWLLSVCAPRVRGADGDADAMYVKAIAAQTGNGATLDLEAGKALLLKAADAGSGRAMSRLGDMYRLPDGGAAVDLAQARRWYDKSAAVNDPYGLLWSANLDDRTLTPDVQNQRYAKAKDVALSMAAKDPTAVFVVGLCYATGNGVERDMETGMGALQQAADDGEVNAMRMVASAYNHGDGLPKDLTKGFEWYSKAAQSGFSLNLMDLGIAYQAGLGVARDDAAAMKYLMQGVDRGSPRCMVIAAQMISQGEGAERDDARAATLFQKAVDLGWFPAMYYLAIAYDTGKGVPQNHETAIALMRKAAKDVAPAAQYLTDHNLPTTAP